MATIKLKNATISKGKISFKKPKSTQSTNKDNFQLLAESRGYKVTPEFRFNPDRQFKADWAIKKGNSITCLVEFEGMGYNSRHTKIVGYSNDCEKYNLAQKTGYSVFRYTTLNFDQVWDDLKHFYLYERE